MKYLLILAAVLTLLIAFAKPVRRDMPIDVVRYVEFAEKVYGQKIDTAVFYVPHLFAPGMVGWCDRAANKVLISAVHWMSMSDTEHQLLILHEVGHCQFKLDHDNEMLLNRPKSIMYWKLMRAVDFLNNKDYYLNELKNRVTK